MGIACCSDQRTAIEKQIAEFLLMINRVPNLINYRHTKEKQLTLARAYTSVYFGGSVLLPLGAVKKYRTRKNPLAQKIKAS
jgi:hypothetical protein